MQQAGSHLMRLAAYCRQVDDLLAALQERVVAASPQQAGVPGVQSPAFLCDAFRQDFKQLTILAKIMDIDARDSHSVLEVTQYELRAAVQQALQFTQAGAEFGRAIASLGGRGRPPALGGAGAGENLRRLCRHLRIAGGVAEDGGIARRSLAC